MSNRATICGVEIGEFDVVRVWGVCSWPEGVVEEGLLCTIAAVWPVAKYEDDYPGIKVWPQDNAHPSGGKVYFAIDKITRLEKVSDPI